jgi:hypothetical protein
MSTLRNELRTLAMHPKALGCWLRVGHHWGRWFFAPLNRYGSTHARFCQRCGARDIATRSTEGLIYWAPRKMARE